MADNLSLRDELQASFDTLSADEAPAAGAQDANLAQGGAGAETSAVEAATPEPAAQDGAGGPERDEHGRFKPKDTPAEGAQAAASPIESETAAPATPEPQTPETTRVPPSLPAAIKAKFGTLDPDVQQAFVALEDSTQKAKAEWGLKGQRLNRIDEILGPHLPRWQMAGLDEYSGIQSLIAAQSLLDQNPVNGIVQIARSYGLTPAHLAQAFGLSQTSGQQQGQEGQPAPTGAPDFTAALAPIVNGLQTLQQRFDQNQQQAQSAQLLQTQSEVDAFAADPANLYFHDVLDDVIKYISADRAAGGKMSIKDAYDRATWANPTIRPLLLDAQAKAAVAEQNRKAEETRKAAEAAARSKSQSANRAAGSVTGSPAPGSTAPSGSHGTIRDDLKASMQELGAL